MAGRRLQFSVLEMAENEHPTSIKFNHWLSLNEKQRLLSGPFSVSLVNSGSFVPTATGVWLEITDSIYDIGGVTITGGTQYTTRKFSIEYQTQLTVSSDYAIWEKTRFHLESGRYMAKLDSTNLYPPGKVLGTGAGQINLSGSLNDYYYCLRDSWS
jgi:hypothetical protein